MCVCSRMWATIFGVSSGPAMNQNGLVSVEYMFKGESAHAAGAPWRGRSALDAVELMDVGWNFRREHLRLAQRSHYVITNGGDQPNVVPPNASVWYYFREADYEHIMDMWHIGDNMAQGCHADDRHHLYFAPAGQRVAGPLQPRRSPRHVREHQEGRAAAVVGRRPDSSAKALQSRAESSGARPGVTHAEEDAAAPQRQRRCGDDGDDGFGGGRGASCPRAAAPTISAMSRGSFRP